MQPCYAFAKKVRTGKKIEDEDLFGPVSGVVGGGVSPAGRPRVPLRLMIALLYLRHAYNESDEGVVERWRETPTWQYFSDLAYFEHRWPCDPSLLVRFRKALGEEGVEALLAQTIQVALTLKLIARKDLATVIVDSTVQAKAVAYPTDIRMLETARAQLVEAAKAHGIDLKQTYAKEGRALSAQAGRYAHARQFRRMRKAIKRQRTLVGRLQRELQRKAPSEMADTLRDILAKAARVVAQTRHRKSPDPGGKLYSLHAPEVRCFSKGKARTPFEFRAKVGLATSVRGNLIVGARAWSGAPYDGHTLQQQMEQATILMEAGDTPPVKSIKPTKAVVDLGYRGVEDDNPGLTIVHRGKARRLDPKEKKLLKRRNAIEPVISHLKSDHRMDRCHLKGETGDRLHAVLCAASYNIRWLLRMIAKKGLRALLRLLPAGLRSAVCAVFRPDGVVLPMATAPLRPSRG